MPSSGLTVIGPRYDNYVTTKVLTARFKSGCTACPAAILPGDEIVNSGRGKNAHVTCPEGGVPFDRGYGRPVRVHVTRFSSGHTQIVNARGRCEDAPCCGCCTY